MGVFGPGLLLDDRTGRPVAGRILSVYETGTKLPTQTFDPDDETTPIVVATNANGYYGQFSVPNAWAVLISTGAEDEVVAAIDRRGTSVQVTQTIATEADLPPVGEAGDAIIARDSGNVWFWDSVTFDWINGGSIQAQVTPEAVAATTGNGEAPVGRGEQGYTITPAVAPDAATLATELGNAATFGVPAILKGSWSLAASVAVPAGSVVDARDATLTMTTDFTPMLTATAGPVHIVGGTFVGKATDYLDAATGGGDLRAPMLKADNATGVRLDGVTARGFAGSALVATGCTNVHVTGCTVVGVGNGGGGGTHVFNPGVSKDNACVVLNAGNTDVWVTGNDLGWAAQGVLGGTGNTRVTITGNHVHDIGGQHGVYLNNATNVTVADNQFVDCKAQGVKMQISTAGAGDVTDVAITGNVGVRVVGATAQLTKSTAAAAGELFRNVTIVGNSNTGGGYVVDIDNVDRATVAANRAVGCTNGVRVRDCTAVVVSGNHVQTVERTGIHLTGATAGFARPTVGVRIVGNTVIDAATANLSNQNYGVLTEGNVTDLTLDSNVVASTAGGMRYGIFTAHSDKSSTSVDFNTARGAFEYGYRGAAVAYRTFRNNQFEGTLGSMNGPPIAGAGYAGREFFGTAAPTSGAYQSGDKMHRYPPVVGQPLGWVCTAGGSPGTWVALPNL